MKNKTDAIKSFLEVSTHSDLAALYNFNMEVQVNVAQEDGEVTEGEYKGTLWRGYTDGLLTWKSFRIPYNANTNPEYTDHPIKFPLEKYAEGIGMTGWNWNEQKTHWVAFDYDNIIGHKQSGLSSEELEHIQEAACSIDWITVRKSTSGNGLHLYIFLENPITTENRTEHSALARYILSMMSAKTGFDFSSKVDICGGNMWVWHRKMTNTPGLELIASGLALSPTLITDNWRDHIEVCQGRRNKSLPKVFLEQNDIDGVDSLYNELTGRYVKEPLDAEHKKLIEYFENNKCFWYWNQDGNMLITHTVHLKEAHEALGLKGIFNTISEGKEWGNDHNCFCFPIRRGGWVVRRFTIGCTETDSWDTDSAGWSRCYYNVNADLKIIASTNEGVEDSDGGYVFNTASQAENTVMKLGSNIHLPNWIRNRPTKIKPHKDSNKIIVEIQREGTDNPNDMQKWIPTKNIWRRIFKINQATSVNETQSYDDLIRHIVTERYQDAGWVIKSDNEWTEEPLSHIKMALKSLGHNLKTIDTILGESVFRKWTLVNKPFQQEYPGDRQWNKNACQLKYYPSKTENKVYPTWSRILSHVGTGLDDAIQDNPWCKKNGILSGGDYLKCWVASLFQFPERPLPYLFLYGPEKSGKSIFHEALAELITSTGYQRADTALLSSSGFNNELRNAVLCVVEETNLSTKNRVAHNRIKDWVTSPTIQIHPKGGDPYMVTNTMKFIQCTNYRDYCPVFTGDTRVTMIRVSPPAELIDKYELITRCRKEAPDFLGEIFEMTLPPSEDKRLNLSIIETSEKFELQSDNRNALEIFLEEQCEYAPGNYLMLREFWERFQQWLEPNEIYEWTKIKTGKNLPEKYPKGRRLADNQLCIGNIAWAGSEFVAREVLILRNNKLLPQRTN